MKLGSQKITGNEKRIWLVLQCQDHSKILMMDYSGQPMPAIGSKDMFEGVYPALVDFIMKPMDSIIIVHYQSIRVLTLY